jgi:hypothetical protein
MVEGAAAAYSRPHRAGDDIGEPYRRSLNIMTDTTITPISVSLTPIAPPIVQHDPHFLVEKLHESLLGFGLVFSFVEGDAEALAKVLAGKNYNEQAVDAACIVFQAALNGNKAQWQHALITIEPELEADALKLVEDVGKELVAALLAHTPINWSTIAASIGPEVVADAQKAFAEFLAGLSPIVDNPPAVE